MRLPSEDVIISAPMSYTGSAQRIMRLRRRASTDRQLVAITAAAVTLIVVVWALVTVWYLIWGIWLIPYRLLRRGARRRRVEAMRHRELLGTIQGSAAGSAAAIVAATATDPSMLAGLTPPTRDPHARVGDAERDDAVEQLREDLLAGRFTAEEFEQRLESAQRARTRGDLEAVRSDLR